MNTTFAQEELLGARHSPASSLATVSLTARIVTRGFCVDITRASKLEPRMIFRIIARSHRYFHYLIGALNILGLLGTERRQLV
jgi:hypothetical protein